MFVKVVCAVLYNILLVMFTLLHLRSIKTLTDAVTKDALISKFSNYHVSAVAKAQFSPIVYLSFSYLFYTHTFIY